MGDGEEKPKTGHTDRADGEPASRHIDERIHSLADWRGETLKGVRRLIHEAEPEVVEEWKWKGTPVWSRAGNLCTGETYKQVVKLTFARGASLDDPTGLFNSSLDGNTRRAIDIREGDTLDPDAFKALIRAAVEANLRARAPKSGASPKPRAKVAPEAAGPAKLLSGGNPQIAKADGEAPVQAYIDAMPGWKREVGRRLDAIIVQVVPAVCKAVKWNSPLYGVEGRGWFLGIHVFTRYIKIAFFRGASLQPPPPVSSKDESTRYFHIHEGDDLDVTRITSWVEQAAALPGRDL